MEKREVQEKMDGIYEKLYDWQKKIVDKLEDKQSWGLFLDCGLGKTPIGLALAERHQCDNILVITINAKALESDEVGGSWLWWAKHIQTDEPYTECTKKSKITDGKKNILVINYEGLYDRKNSNTRIMVLKPILNDFIANSKGKRVAIIVDESHHMKDLNTLQTRAIYQIQKQLKPIAENVWTYLLTGTPFTQGFIDLYSQLKFLGCKMTKGEFKDKFCEIGHIGGLMGWQQPIVGYKNLDELYDLIHQFATTVKSTDVVELPEQIFVDHVVDTKNCFGLFTKKSMIAEESTRINDFRKENGLPFFQADELAEYQEYKLNPWNRNLTAPDMKYAADTPALLWLRARQAAIGFQGNAQDYTVYDRSRFKALESFLAENPDNYVLFFNYTPELTELYDICEKLKYKIDVYCGDLKSTHYYDEYARMPESKRLATTRRIILANFASGSTGLNLQAYSKAIIFSLPVYKDYEQALKRIHRIGQHKTTTYHFFTGDNWLEKKMRESLEKKEDYNIEMFKKDFTIFEQ